MDLRYKPLSGVVGLLVLSHSPLAYAQDTGLAQPFSGSLVDVVSSLYGGDGIRLQGSDIFSHAAHFTGDSLVQFNQLSLGVRDLSFPVLNPQIGVRFRYDAVLDEFVPVTESISASAFALDAETVGAGEFHIGVAYSFRRFSELDGAPLDDLSVDLAHMDLGNNGPDLPCLGGPPGACYAFERDVVRLSIDLGIKEEMLALTSAYGISDRIDVGLFLPILKSTVDVTSSATIIEHSSREFFPASVHLFGGDGDDPNDSLRASRTGLGDAVFRINYGVIAHRDTGWNINASLDVRLPSGQVDNLQGLPGTGVKPRLVASREIDIGFAIARPHFNIAYGFNAGVNKEQMLDYAAGGSLVFDLGDTDAIFALGADFLGKHVTANKDGMGDNQYDVSFGAKLNLRNSVNFFYNVLLPVNESGLRPNAQHVVGLQFKF